MALSIAFVLPFGEASETFLPDSSIAILAADAREAGHRAVIAHVYYDGRERARDAEVGRRLAAWLEGVAPDVVVAERMVDPAAFRGRRTILVSRGESADVIPEVELLVGAFPGAARRGVVGRRTPSMGELRHALAGALAKIAAGEEPRGVPGVAWMEGGDVVGAPAEGERPMVPFRPVFEHEVIALEAPPVQRRKTIFGNVGCPYGSDPTEGAHHRGLRLADDGSVARLGCAFCHMGGDYQKRDDAVVVAELVEQALVWTQARAEVEELVLSDQHPMRYLGALMDAAAAAGVRPVRWLFAARADAFVRERARIEAAIAAAARAGQQLEVYLSGFEAFSDRELERYHKGTTVAEMVRAVGVMRELAKAHPGTFEYARARGHSLILWNPWTAPEDLRETAENVRAHGLAELFHELGRNRLRLYRDLPIHAAAERDGAVLDAWEEGDAGAARAKGYNPERPWKFLDRRTAAAHRVARGLRELLGHETEVAQLAAVAAWAEAGAAGTPDAILDGVQALRDVLGSLARDARPPGAPMRGAWERAAVVKLGGACNNGCAACANRDTWLDDATDAVRTRIATARATGLPIVLAGREPTMHPEIVALIAAARGDDGRRVGIVTNGRRFAYARFTEEAVRAGLTAASVKVFAPDSPTADAIARDPESVAHAQALAGIRALRTAGLRPLELRAPLHARNLATLDTYPTLATRLGLRQLRIEAALDAIGLAHAATAAAALPRLADACARAAIALEASPLESATLLFERLPTAPPD